MKGKIEMMMLAKFRRSARPADSGAGKRFEFSTDGNTTFVNFSTSDILRILAVMRGEDAMSARFGDDR